MLRRAEVAKTKNAEPLIGHSPVWQQALARARQAALTDADILIEAESGTGKELVARFIHRLSAPQSGPFVAVNCAAFPEALLESELFGHARGAFTGAVEARPGKFEMATGARCCSTKWASCRWRSQPKLLRALQEREFDRLGSNQTVRVDIRVVATTNRPLEAAVAEGRFPRRSLLPAECDSDGAAAVARPGRGYSGTGAAFCRNLYARAGNRAPQLSEELLARMAAEPWPGNVRELANFVRRAVALSAGGEIGWRRLRTAQLRRRGRPARQSRMEAGTVARRNGAAAFLP